MQTAHLETNGTVIRPIDLGLYQRLTVIAWNFSARTLFGCFIGLMLVIGAIALFDRTYFSAAILLAMCAFMIATPVAALVTIGHDTLTVLDPRRALIVDSQIFIFMVVVVMC